MARPVPSIHCHLPLSFSGFILEKKKERKKNFLKEKHGKKTPLSTFHTTNYSTLAQHALKLICQTTFDSILFKSLLSHTVSCLVVTSRRSRDRKRDFQLQTTQMLEASCLFSFKSVLLRTSGKCQSIKRTACMLNFIYIVQSK